MERLVRLCELVVALLLVRFELGVSQSLCQITASYVGCTYLVDPDTEAPCDQLEPRETDCSQNVTESFLVENLGSQDMQIFEVDGTVQNGEESFTLRLLEQLDVSRGDTATLVLGLEVDACAGVAFAGNIVVVARVSTMHVAPLWAYYGCLTLCLPIHLFSLRT